LNDLRQMGAESVSENAVSKLIYDRIENVCLVPYSCHDCGGHVRFLVHIQFLLFHSSLLHPAQDAFESTTKQLSGCSELALILLVGMTPHQRHNPIRGA